MKQVVIAALVSLAPAVASAEVWNVSEGPQAKVKGQWTVMLSGAELTGKATMSNLNGQTLTYNIAGQQKDGGYVLHRSNSLDNAKCTYVGKPAPDGSINGSSICNGQNAPWIVTRAK